MERSEEKFVGALRAILALKQGHDEAMAALADIGLKIDPSAHLTAYRNLADNAWRDLRPWDGRKLWAYIMASQNNIHRGYVPKIVHIPADRFDEVVASWDAPSLLMGDSKDVGFFRWRYCDEKDVPKNASHGAGFNEIAWWSVLKGSDAVDTSRGKHMTVWNYEGYLDATMSAEAIELYRAITGRDI